MPGRSLGELGDRKIVHPARVKTFAGQKKTEGMLEVGIVLKEHAGVVV